MAKRTADENGPVLSTRERLIDAAVRVVARDGLEAASVKSIATEAGAPPGVLHYHFPTKDALLEAALRQAFEAFQARVRERRARTPPDGQFDSLFTDAVAEARAEADHFRLRLGFAVRANTQPQLAEVMRELNAAGAEEIALTLAAGAGREAPTQAERALGRTLKAAHDGIMLAWLNDPTFPLSEARDALAAGARAWLGLHDKR